MPGEHKRLDFSHYRRVDLPRNEALFLEDEASREMYVLLVGALGVYRNEVQVATIDEPLSIVGEMSALTSSPRNATVRALKQSKLVVVDDPDALFHEYPQMASKLARLLARRLESMNAKFIDLKGVYAKVKVAADQRLSTDATVLVPGLAVPDEVARFREAGSTAGAGPRATGAAEAPEAVMSSDAIATPPPMPALKLEEVVAEEPTPTLTRAPARKPTPLSPAGPSAPATSPSASPPVTAAATAPPASPGSPRPAPNPEILNVTLFGPNVDPKYRDEVLTALNSILDWDFEAT